MVSSRALPTRRCNKSGYNVVVVVVVAVVVVAVVVVVVVVVMLMSNCLNQVFLLYKSRV